MPTDMYGQPQVQGNGGSFAQKMQQRANPIMANRPAMGNMMAKPNTQGAAIGAANTMNNYMRPNPISGQRPGLNAMNANPGMQGSRAQLQAKAQAQKQQGLGPSVDPVQQLQQNLAAQKGLKTPYDMQLQQEQAVPELPSMPYPEPEVDMGSQDPRELARMGLAPSNPMQMMNQQPVVMDENGLEPRRGAR